MINLGNDPEKNTVFLNPDKLTSHAAVFGMTGSGKTGQLIGMAEGLIRKNIPLLLVDIKGDLTNIAVQSGYLGNYMQVRLLTPGGDHGDPVNIFTGLNNPEQATGVVSALLEMVGLDGDPVKSSEHVLLSYALKYFHARQEWVTLEGLIQLVSEPPFDRLGALELDKAISKRKRSNLAAQLNNVLASPVFASWRAGIDLDFDTLFAPTYDNRTPVIIYSVAHLNTQSERLFAITYLLGEYKTWLLKQQGSQTLRSVIMIDECAGIMPPHPYVPSTKPDLMILLKQGRAFGGGVILATQNPKDVDYKGLSNCGTWIVGRLQTVNDRERVIEGLLSTGAYGKKQLHTLLKQLGKRQFVVARDSQWEVFKSKQVETVLSGPMTPLEIKDLVDQGLICLVYNVSVLFNNLMEAKNRYREAGTEDSMRSYLDAVNEYNRATGAS